MSEIVKTFFEKLPFFVIWMMWMAEWGVVHKLRQPPEGGRGSSKCWRGLTRGGGGFKQVVPLKCGKFVSKPLFFQPPKKSYATIFFNDFFTKKLPKLRKNNLGHKKLKTTPYTLIYFKYSLYFDICFVEPITFLKSYLKIIVLSLANLAKVHRTLRKC